MLPSDLLVWGECTTLTAACGQARNTRWLTTVEYALLIEEVAMRATTGMTPFAIVQLLRAAELAVGIRETQGPLSVYDD